MVLFMPRDAASVPITRQVLDSCLETLGVTDDTRTDIALALSEACANVVLHAEMEQEYEVMARAAEGRCVIEVANGGDGTVPAVPPSDPVPLTAEAGRGDKLAGQAGRHAVGTARGPVLVQALGHAHGELGQVVTNVAGVGDQCKWDHPGYHCNSEMVLGRPPPVQRRLGHGGAFGHLVHVQPPIPPG